MSPVVLCSLSHVSLPLLSRGSLGSSRGLSFFDSQRADYLFKEQAVLLVNGLDSVPRILHEEPRPFRLRLDFTSPNLLHALNVFRAPNSLQDWKFISEKLDRENVVRVDTDKALIKSKQHKQTP
nr:MAG TPA_asm: hypothetical protein [Bacteriophage sp.]